MADGDELFELAPEDFVAARAALAKAVPEPDRSRIKALRRPTVGAWLVNQLVRAHRESIEELLLVGTRLRAAQQSGRGDDLRTLATDRRRLTDGLVAAALDIAVEAGRTVTAELQAAVASSLDAAVADAGLAKQLREARLTEPLSYAGFGAFGLTTVRDDAFVQPVAAKPAPPPAGPT
ncbi:MAG: hypothetical protein JWM93_2319, partial [Frankiales bacterium]|nr:hypothetical protein [Frankiales bacterium]